MREDYFNSFKLKKKDPIEKYEDFKIRCLVEQKLLEKKKSERKNQNNQSMSAKLPNKSQSSKNVKQPYLKVIEQEKKQKREEYLKQKKEKLKEFEETKQELLNEVEIDKLHSKYIKERKHLDKNQS